jgi:hypothetical protein
MLMGVVVVPNYYLFIGGDPHIDPWLRNLSGKAQYTHCEYYCSSECNDGSFHAIFLIIDISFNCLSCSPLKPIRADCYRQLLGGYNPFPLPLLCPPVALELIHPYQFPPICFFGKEAIIPLVGDISLKSYRAPVFNAILSELFYKVT